MSTVPVTSTVAEFERMTVAYPPLDHRTQQELAILAKTGTGAEREQATEMLFKHNAGRFLYFVRLYAKDVDRTRHDNLDKDHKYMLRWKDHAPWTMTSDEIISASLAGFWRAVTTFDPTRGNFNPHCNIAIWRAIQETRKREEKRGSHITESIEATEEAFPGTPEASSDAEREIARVIFERHMERHCPDAAERVLRMLNGKEPEDIRFLAEVGKRLRAAVPVNDLAWLRETLGWRDS